jgi:hypothetical protein
MDEFRVPEVFDGETILEEEDLDLGFGAELFIVGVDAGTVL